MVTFKYYTYSLPMSVVIGNIKAVVYDNGYRYDVKKKKIMNAHVG